MATVFATAYHPNGRVPRRGQRADISLPALIRLLGQQHSARVHNLSSGGAMIETLATVRKNDPITFSCGTIEAVGKVVWTQPGRFGLEFLTPIEEALIVHQLRRSDAVVSRRSVRQAARDN